MKIVIGILVLIWITGMTVAIWTGDWNTVLLDVAAMVVGGLGGWCIAAWSRKAGRTQ